MPSTVIRRYAYDHSTAQLWVEFVSGRRYVYTDVPPQVAETLRQRCLFQQPDS